ncbi:hypothetical protein [Ideonella sp.]
MALGAVLTIERLACLNGCGLAAPSVVFLGQQWPGQAEGQSQGTKSPRW